MALAGVGVLQVDSGWWTSEPHMEAGGGGGGVGRRGEVGGMFRG